MLAASTDNCSIHIWEDLWDSCQLQVATQIHIPSNTYLRETDRERLELIATQDQIPTNTYLRETFRERLELIATQVQSPTADQRPERWRQLTDLAPTQVTVPQFATLIKFAVFEHALAICTRAESMM